MNLRPHHILCIQKFTGHGYSADFTAHMTAVVSELAENPKTAVTLSKGCDDLCSRCPHNRDGICTSLEKVASMDQKVLESCGLSGGEELPWQALADLAKKQIFETTEFFKVCGGCQWFELCRNTEVSHESQNA